MTLGMKHAAHAVPIDRPVDLQPGALPQRHDCMQPVIKITHDYLNITSLFGSMNRNFDIPATNKRS